MIPQSHEIIHITESDIQHMVVESIRLLSERNSRGYWTKERCYDEAKKYGSKAELMKHNKTVYNLSVEKGWINDYIWFKSNWGKWNRQTCYDEAQKYKSKVDFQKKSNGAYTIAWKNGWLNDYTWFQKPNITEKPTYVVYKYEDKETNSVYVGLTKCIENRHKQHCNGHLVHGSRKYDIVYLFFHSLGKEPPKPVILKEKLYADEAQRYEISYVLKYKNEGLNVLNLAKAGSLGGYGKWSKEKCYNEAKKYKTRTEFAKKNGSAYSAARKNGWLDDYTWFDNRLVWTRESCYNEAKKYQSKIQFKHGANGAYQAALKNGWMDDYTWFENGRIKWNYDTCYSEAKKYSLKSEFKKNSNTAYKIAAKHGWLTDYNWLKRNNSFKNNN